MTTPAQPRRTAGRSSLRRSSRRVRTGDDPANDLPRVQFGLGSTGASSIVDFARMHGQNQSSVAWFGWALGAVLAVIGLVGESPVLGIAGVTCLVAMTVWSTRRWLRRRPSSTR